MCSIVARMLLVRGESLSAASPELVNNKPQHAHTGMQSVKVIDNRMIRYSVFCTLTVIYTTTSSSTLHVSYCSIYGNLSMAVKQLVLPM